VRRDDELMLSNAYAELSRQAPGASQEDLRLAALQVGGHEGSSTFGSVAEELRAVAGLRQGLADGSLAARYLDESDVQAEHDRIAERYATSTDSRMPRIDARKNAAATAPRPLPETSYRQPAKLTAEQDAETDRLLALSQEDGPSRPKYGSVQLASGAERERDAALSRIAERAPVSDEVILSRVMGWPASSRDPGELALSTGTVGLAASVSAEDRRALAAKGHALPDGCLAAETLVATRRGPQRIDSLTGRCEVLTDVGWAQAEVRSFGVQPLLAVTLRRGKAHQTVYATSGHRWLMDSGEWKLTDGLVSGARIPHVEVLHESVPSYGLNVADSRVASDAQQASDCASRVIVVNLETSDPVPVRASAGRDFGDTSADGASPVLALDHGLEIVLSESVLAQEGSISSAHPSFVPEFDLGPADPGAFSHAEAAVGTAELAGGTNVEVGMRPFSATCPARDWPLVGDRHSVDLFRRSWPGFGLAKSNPAAVAAIAPSVHGSWALRWLSAIRARLQRHSFNDIQSPTWSVIKVEETSRREEVFCAVVPDLHRFVLASGVLTGNSYPIPDLAHLHAAAILARSKHGDVAAAKKLIARRAKELGVANPLESNEVSTTALALSVQMATGDVALARSGWHGGPGQQVTTATRAHSAEVQDDPSDDLETRLAKIRARHPDVFGRPGDPTQGGSPDRAGNTVTRPKSAGQRARERRREHHTASDEGWR
jgi:hypothetical protein